jgi:hypothetical protein
MYLNLNLLPPYFTLFWLMHVSFSPLGRGLR